MRIELNRRTLSRAAVALACVGGLSSGTAMANEHVLILLDTTGSMTLESAGMKTRLQVAKDRINTFLDSMPTEPREYSFWTFSGTAATPVYTFAAHATKEQVRTAVNGATAVGNTPLAHSICAAIDHLMAYLPTELHRKKVYLATDGEENATLATDKCAGPNSATAWPNLERDSWQWKVRNMACTLDPLSPGICGDFPPPWPEALTMVVEIDHLFTDYIPFGASARSADVEDAPRSLTASATTTTNADAAFFQGITRETHGAYAGVTPTTPVAQASPLPGDANRDGCVNVTDRSVVLTQYGKAVPPGTPADFNRNNVVDSADYQTVLNNYGRGCPVQ